MSKHTPGPWVLKRSTTPDNVGGFDWAISKGSHIIAEAYEVVDYGKTLPVEANARLISAAPDMYEALQAIIARWETPAWKDTEPTAEVINRARAALSKAEGGGQ